MKNNVFKSRKFMCELLLQFSNLLLQFLRWILEIWSDFWFRPRNFKNLIFADFWHSVTFKIRYFHSWGVGTNSELWSNIIYFINIYNKEFISKISGGDRLWSWFLGIVIKSSHVQCSLCTKFSRIQNARNNIFHSC